jgi:anti-sigma-K factor RskA
MLARLRADGTVVAEPFAVAETGSPELWLVAEGTAPVSLGILAAEERSSHDVPEAADPIARPGSQLVITLEPSGGSPTGQPTGPVLGAGPLTDI